MRKIVNHFEQLVTFLLVAWRVSAPSLAESYGQSIASGPVEPGSPGWLAPSAIATTRDGSKMFVSCAKAHRVDLLDSVTAKVTQSFRLAGEPSGVILSSDERHAYITCAGPQSRVFELDLVNGVLSAEWKTGHTALSPVLSPDGKTLYVCLRFENQIAAFDLVARHEASPIPVGREPVSAAVTPDGRFLFVAHHLPAGPANTAGVAATMGVVALSDARMEKELPLPSGSSLLRQIRLSPDGRYAAITHNLGHYQVPTTQLERGWMNTSALTLVETATQQILGTVLLDEIDRGAANPWAVAWTADGQKLLVTHAGTHELSVVDFSALIAKLAALRTKPDPDAIPAEDLAFLVGLRQRIKLCGNGPRSEAVVGNIVYVADYFSDQIECLDLGKTPFTHQAISLQAHESESLLRRGERLFNDASISFQGWQSCATCHSEDARVDGLNWDLLNDGVGNPKNTKSLLLAYATPPSMSTGVRYTAEEAVRAGIEHILFDEPSEGLAQPLDQWLKSLRPMPSPYLRNGQLSPAARRGERIFKGPRAGCLGCHPPRWFTDLKSYDVGTTGPMDQGVRRFDTPTLLELWRTAPYLHDGSAATLLDVLTTHNAEDRHGRVSQLSETELDDLVEYLLSL